MSGMEIVLAVCWWLTQRSLIAPPPVEQLPVEQLPVEQPQVERPLIIRVVNLAPDAGGYLALAMFDDPDRFDRRTDPVRRAYVPVTSASHEWVIDDLPPGDYAATAYHDRNANRRLDKGRLGIPKEPYGFSNEARGRLGPPAFERARVTVTGSSQVIVVRLGER